MKLKRPPWLGNLLKQLFMLKKLPYNSREGFMLFAKRRIFDGAFQRCRGAPRGSGDLTDPADRLSRQVCDLVGHTLMPKRQLRNPLRDPAGAFQKSHLKSGHTICSCFQKSKKTSCQRPEPAENTHNFAFPLFSTQFCWNPPTKLYNKNATIYPSLLGFKS